MITKENIIIDYSMSENTPGLFGKIILPDGHYYQCENCGEKHYGRSCLIEENDKVYCLYDYICTIDEFIAAIQEEK